MSLTKQPYRKSKTGEDGVALVETLIAILIIAVGLVIAAQHFVVLATLMGLHARQRLAESQSEAAVSKVLALKPTDNTASFTLGQNNTITLAGVQTGYYDYVIGPDPLSSASPSLPAGCGAWPCAVDPANQPSNTAIVLLRVWTVQTIDSKRGVRLVRVAAFPGTALNQTADKTAITSRVSQVPYH